ncbi:platelet endothelial cell adhesion molecule isoform X3 [Dromiciops gliroides]|uniref:platelet endothelial cell adhesion molecule isoform X3 n=1 Tax=Dromiciops gliroides TaxID=33562 RepID=UPI001CC6BE38|nr:platelet endothelial cell adhesion molecule isoform X3 [Dromiciops gliroides]
MYLALLGMLWFCPRLKGQENSFTINMIEMKAEPGWEVENGKNLTLKCIVDISSTSKLQSQHQVLFYKDDILLKNVTSQNKEEAIFIQAARIYDRGNYKCTVILNNKEKTTKDYSVSVKGVPNPRVTVDKVEVMEGGMVTVECAVPEEKPPIYFIVEKLEMDICKQRKEKTILHNNYVTLEFPIEEQDNVLIFQCQAKISFGNFLEASEFTKSDLVTVRETFSIPSFQITPEGEITEGDPLKLKCTIRVTHMFLEDREIIIQKDREIVAYAKHGTEVTYSPPIAKVEHIGNYTCKVESSKISKVNSIFINITELFSKPKLLISSNHLDEGGKLDLSCQIAGSPLANFTIKKENTTITNSQNFTKRVWIYDSGVYRCLAAVRNVIKESDPVRLYVFEIVSKPRIFHNSRSEVIKGQDLEVYCQSVNGTPPIIYYLCKMNTCKSQKEMFTHEPATFLEKPTATTEYTCIAKNYHSQGSVTSDILNVVVIVPVSRVNLSNLLHEEVESGQNVALLCSTDEGSWPIHYKFYKHNAVVPSYETTLNDTKAIWDNLEVSKKDEGQYYCTASNRANIHSRISKSNIITVKVTLAPWMKGLIAVVIIGAIIIALVVVARWYFFKKSKAKQMPVEMSRPGPPPNSNTEKMQSDPNVEANSHSGLGYNDDTGNHTMKPANEQKEPDHLNMDVEYTEVEVLTPDLHKAPERKGTETVYSEIRKAGSGENRHSRIEGSLDAT